MAEERVNPRHLKTLDLEDHRQEAREVYKEARGWNRVCSRWYQIRNIMDRRRPFRDMRAALNWLRLYFISGPEVA